MAATIENIFLNNEEHIILTDETKYIELVQQSGRGRTNLYLRHNTGYNTKPIIPSRHKLYRLDIKTTEFKIVAVGKVAIELLLAYE